MKNQPTLAAHLADPDQADMERYQAILVEVHRYIDTFTPSLQALVRPFFETLAQGEFSQVVALLPAWLSDLLPVSAEVSHRLGLAHLYGWWYYCVQDALLDGEAPAAALLGGHLALLQMVDLYGTLGLTAAPCWADFQRLALTSAECYSLELQTRFSSPADLTSDRLAPLTIEFVMNRGAPFYFNTLAQLHLAGIPVGHPLRQDLLTALRCFGAARQLGDDAGDWLEDLQDGRLNYVSARLVGRLYQRGLATREADLEPERLAGYQLSDEAFWTAIEQTTQALSQQALAHLAPYGASRLQALIHRQMARQAEQWAAGRAQRAQLRALFDLQPTE